jgi:ribose transport system permease protein
VSGRRSRAIGGVVRVAIENAPLLLFAGVLAFFASRSPAFLTGGNLFNIVTQSASTAVVATGMTFVLLTGGVDLSVGGVMFVAAAVAGKLVLAGHSLPLALAAMLAVGLAAGAVNALFVVRLRVLPFVVTLATLFLGRGLALWITETRAMNLPGGFLRLGTERVAGVPLPALLLAAVLITAHVVLRSTAFGRELYAIGHDPAAARKAGLPVERRLAAVYLISGVGAAFGAVLALAQLGAVSPTFGREKEFAAIAAAVLGGTSLFGGRGQVLPGTLLGALLIQTVENGLVVLNADPYLYPLITSAVIFAAVLTDSLRSGWLARLHRRRIRPEEV